MDRSITQAVWIDLVQPSDAERSEVERATGLRVPSRDELSEVESSSRLNFHNNIFRLSTPLVTRSDHPTQELSPVGLVFAQDRLLTVRYADSRSFNIFSEQFGNDDVPSTAVGAFFGLLEALIDRLADVLERVGADLGALSRTVFKPEMVSDTGRSSDLALRSVLQQLGHHGDLISNLRDSLLGLGRILAYVSESEVAWMPKEMQPRLRTMRGDLQSLNDYDQQLNNKVQFLLDATLGFINIQQNSIIKLLTVASIVGIPPTLIAGVYGMNFERMPELKWAYGYPYSLILMVVSGLLPLALLRWRKWF